MLASITPLGERSRGFRWPVTATAFAVGALGAAGLGGAALGALGSALPAGDWRDWLVAGVAATALLVDASPLRSRLPTTRRQVNEDWLGRYRGWVYGAGFGAQLGLAVVTIVSSAAVYAMVVAAFAAGTVGRGALIGLCFGAVRTLSLLPARRATDTTRLTELHRRVAALQRPFANVALALAGAAVLCALGGAL